MDKAERERILGRYANHVRRFEAAAARRGPESAQVISLPAAVRDAELTEREFEVLQLVADGLSNREIGERLHLSEETVKTHLRHLLAKLSARSRAHLVALGFRRGLLT